MKLCKDCKHFIPASEACARATFVDYVYGKDRHFSASVERGSTNDGDCGNEGRFWEAKTVAYEPPRVQDNPQLQGIIEP